MNFIVFDLEATCWEGKPENKVQEIIEIGAVRLSAFGEVEDTFCRFVRPVLNPSLSVFCRQLTRIEQRDIDKAAGFAKVIDEFQDWADIFYEDYLLCSWGNFDRKMLVQDCKLHKLDSEWALEHINLKRQYQDIRKLKKKRGLQAALEKEGFEFEGSPHRAIDDAKNLVKIFLKHLDEWAY
ncbi:MAG: exonuclease domain-containing protein [Saprospirales bacterium]|nr:exonuclease domain-containing protein [Saprospirales bacterium]MBK6904685.1 exonuclease domain-containing protein [Saprospirales bacterium]MBK7336320.1 exonuclease domain-containing protein [Saprospirales bacterium]